MAKGIFRTAQPDKARPNDPESLFRDLKGRDPEIRHLWSHQADLLRTYNEHHLGSADVALQLPTGAGKTLVGLLIAEFRRRKNDERIAYLCPTRQLAHQVATHAQKYGIHANAFVGRQSEYPAAPFAEYQTGSALAITTYSGLFNTNPRINDAQVIICDDAHAGESFITSMWSVELDRSAHATAYAAVIDLVRADLPPGLAARLGDDDLFPGDRWFVELVPAHALRRVASQLRDALDAHLTGTSARYAWQTIREHVHACHIYVSWNGVLIRPFIAPTGIHPPFADARQRIYMSATLGEGGELERVTGMARIERLPIPAGWDKQGSGRRLFLLPELTLDHAQACSVALNATQKTDRALVLVPTESRVSECEYALATAGLTVLRARDIETSLDPFVNANRAALILANRYDGLDLPGDACRLLVLEGLPGGTNLQESFLLSRLQANALLRDRMITRFTQAVGRCTRSDTDYALVIVKGTKLIDFILKAEHRSLLHPELQAELGFGIDNSKERTTSDFDSLADEFLQQSDDWKSAESEITKARDEKTQTIDPISEALARAVQDEVRFSYALWAGRYEDALSYAQAVADALNANGVQGYRAWWYYCTAESALGLHEETANDAHLETARDRFRRAAQCAPAVPWFSRIARRQVEARAEAEPEELLATAAEGIAHFLAEAGFTGPRFEARMGACLEDLRQTAHTCFHRGLKALGDMLGFRASQPQGEGVPDGVWILGDSMFIGHEAKTQQAAGGAISVTDARQASGHANWIRTNMGGGADVPVICTVITSRQAISTAAIPHTEGLYHLLPADVLRLAEDAASMLRAVRSEAAGCADDSALAIIIRKCREHHLTPEEILTRLTARRARELQQQ
ncbi:MAG: DEAD/DEAH box helicase [Phycisphaerae bacterium]|nr:DEAD/DEAH box helicase [Phycisphaerae bacterium]